MIPDADLLRGRRAPSVATSARRRVLQRLRSQTRHREASTWGLPILWRWGGSGVAHDCAKPYSRRSASTSATPG
jgi:hypothetical protein